METSDREPLSNDVVLSTLSALVDCPRELRSYRAVNLLWFQICNKKTMQLSTFQGLKRIVSPWPDGLGYSRLVEPAENATVRNIRRLRVNDRENFLKHADALHFFETFGDKMKYLSLEHAETEMTSASHLKFIENVLYEWCPNLDELRLARLFQNDIEVASQDEKTDEISLKKLVLDYAQDEFTSVNILRSVIRKIIQRAKNLESFVYIGYKFDPLLQAIPVELMRLINANTRGLTTMELLDVSIEGEAFRLITRAGWPLKRFVYIGRPDSEIRIRDLNLFLNAHIKTLKYLHLEVHWFSHFADHDVELNVHALENLQVLKIAVQNINVGSSGLLGTLKHLRYLTLWGSTAYESAQHDIETMFREKISRSLKYLVLDSTYARHISSIRKYCPNVTELEISFLMRNVDLFTRDLHDLVCDKSILQNITVTAIFENLEIFNDDYVESLVVGLFHCPFRVLTVATSHNRNNFPWLRLNWIEDGLLQNNNTYYRIELKRFVLRDDELQTICRILTYRSNFVTLVDCKVNAVKTGGVLDLPEATLYKDNVVEVVNKIIEDAQLMERIVINPNYDPYEALNVW